MHQVVQELRVERGVVPAAEVEGPRAQHVERERQRREGQHLRHPRVQGSQEQPAAAPGQRAQRERHRGAEGAEQPAPPSTGSCAAPCARSAACRRTPPSPEQVANTNRPPSRRRRTRASGRPASGHRARGGATHRPGRGPPPTAVSTNRRARAPIGEHAEGGERRHAASVGRRFGTETPGAGMPPGARGAIMATWRQQRLSRRPGSTVTTTARAWSRWARSSGSPAS